MYKRQVVHSSFSSPFSLAIAYVLHKDIIESTLSPGSGLKRLSSHLISRVTLTHVTCVKVWCIFAPSAGVDNKQKCMLKGSFRTYGKGVHGVIRETGNPAALREPGRLRLPGYARSLDCRASHLSFLRRPCRVLFFCVVFGTFVRVALPFFFRASIGTVHVLSLIHI